MGEPGSAGGWPDLPVVSPLRGQAGFQQREQTQCPPQSQTEVLAGAPGLESDPELGSQWIPVLQGQLCLELTVGLLCFGFCVFLFKLNVIKNYFIRSDLCK